MVLGIVRLQAVGGVVEILAAADGLAADCAASSPVKITWRWRARVTATLKRLSLFMKVTVLRCERRVGAEAEQHDVALVALEGVRRADGDIVILQTSST